MSDTQCKRCHVTPCCCDTALETKFPREMVGLPTSEVLIYLADQFEKFGEETSGHSPSDGYFYAESWLRQWAEDANEVEDTRCPKCVACTTGRAMPETPYVNQAWICKRCQHSIFEH